MLSILWVTTLAGFLCPMVNQRQPLRNLKHWKRCRLKQKNNYYLYYYTITIMKKFDRKAVEELWNTANATEETIEAVVGKLVMNEELKTGDEEGDLVTIMRTMTVEGVEVINYDRRTTREENDKLSFQIVIGREAEATQTEPADEQSEPAEAQSENAE